MLFLKVISNKFLSVKLNFNCLVTCLSLFISGWKIDFRPFWDGIEKQLSICDATIEIGKVHRLFLLPFFVFISEKVCFEAPSAVAGSDNFAISDSCIGCICEASTRCNLTAGCISGGALCGPFLLSRCVICC